MAKKGAQIQLQVEVENDEDWDKLLNKEGLIVVDVYSEWCGPCTGMVGNLRKLKLELGGDILTLAVAKTDNITALERFRNKSRPTWMFISNRKLIRLMFGTNAPMLAAVITEELKKTEEALKDKTPREGIEVHELTEEEQAVLDEENRIAEEMARIETEAREQAILERRTAVVNAVKDNIKEVSMIMILPHVTYDQHNVIHDHMNANHLSNVGKPSKKALKDEEIFEIFYYYDLEYDQQILDYFKSGEIVAMAYQVQGDMGEEDAVSYLTRIIYGEDAFPPGTDDSLAKKLEKLVEKEITEDVEEEETDEGFEDDLNKSVKSVISNKEDKASLAKAKSGSLKGSVKTSSILSAKGGMEMLGEEEEVEDFEDVRMSITSEGLHRNTQESVRSVRGSRVSTKQVKSIEMIALPGIWTPLNPETKVMAMRIFFPAITAKFDLPEIEEIPPHLIVAFDAFKEKEVLQLASEYPQETMRLGFFTSADPAEAQVIAKTPEAYEHISAPPYGAKIVVQVSKKKSEPLLSYATLGPVYVSPNTVVGELDSQRFFPDDYLESLRGEEEEVKTKKKKKTRGSKSAVTSTMSFLGTEEEEGTRAEEEFEMEGEIEEEGEAEPNDMDIFDFGAEGADFSLVGHEKKGEESAIEEEVQEEDKATSPMQN